MMELCSLLSILHLKRSPNLRRYPLASSPCINSRIFTSRICQLNSWKALIQTKGKTTRLSSTFLLYSFSTGMAQTCTILKFVLFTHLPRSHKKFENVLLSSKLKNMKVPFLWSCNDSLVFINLFHAYLYLITRCIAHQISHFLLGYKLWSLLG